MEQYSLQDMMHWEVDNNREKNIKERTRVSTQPISEIAHIDMKYTISDPRHDGKCEYEWHSSNQEASYAIANMWEIVSTGDDRHRDDKECKNENNLLLEDPYSKVWEYELEYQHSKHRQKSYKQNMFQSDFIEIVLYLYGTKREIDK